ncbi:MAG: zinc-binding dehydrogenase [Chloroflexia bacterium]
MAYHAVERSGILAGQVGVVFGAGTIGLLTAQILTRARGCRAIVVDLDEQRLATAQKLGAIPVYSGRDKPADAVSSATGGEMADVVFEATGSEVCTRMTTELVAHAGTIVLVGWNKGAVEVDTVALISKEADLLGSRNSANAFPAVLRMLEDGVVDADAMITHEFSLDDAAAAIELLDRAGANALKVLIHRT